MTKHLTGTLAERLEAGARVDPSGCKTWVHTKPNPVNGYASLSYKAERDTVHRMAYKLHVGPIPEGLTIDHLCFNKLCVNTDHMEVVTREENARRGSIHRNEMHGGRWNPHLTHCLRGHALTGPEANVRWDDARQICRTCDNIRAAGYRSQRRVAP